MTCNHIVGYTINDIPLVKPEYADVSPFVKLVMMDGCFETTGDTVFNFCPLCGQKLKYDPKLMFMVEDD